MDKDDILVIPHSEDFTQWLEVNGDEHALDITGHFPVLAGLDIFGNELYIARVYPPRELQCAYTYVSQGARNVSLPGNTFMASYLIKQEYSMSKFEVLVLKFDPCDVGLQVIPRDAKFQTGPVYWIGKESEEHPYVGTSGQHFLYWRYWDRRPEIEDTPRELESFYDDTDDSSSEASGASMDDAEYPGYASSRDWGVAASSHNPCDPGELGTASGIEEIPVVDETEVSVVEENTSADSSTEGQGEEPSGYDALVVIQRERRLIEEQKQALAEQMRRLEVRDRELDSEELQVINSFGEQASPSECEGWE